MTKPVFQNDWPELWKESYKYDLIEMYGDKSVPNYTYAYLNRFHGIIDRVKKYVPIGSTVLDVAAAQGNFSITLAELGYNMYWNDLRENLIDYVKLKKGDTDIHFQPGNVFDLKIGQQLDAVLITEIIEHVAHPDDFLNQIANLVKKDGLIFMSTPLGSYFLNKLPKFSDCADPSQYEAQQFKPNSDGHIFLLHLEEMKEMAKKVNLQIVESYTFNNSLTWGHLKIHLILKYIPKFIINGFEKLVNVLPWFIRKRLNSHMIVVFKKS
jgi:2-polyprenyl-3-methyl-5-hydroxy-6-metoxy-1,4-benzoquinol methylase